MTTPQDTPLLTAEMAHGGLLIGAVRPEAKGLIAALRALASGKTVCVPAPVDGEREAIIAAARTLRQYAVIVRSCRADEIERFAYLPELEDQIERLSAIAARRSAPPSPAAPGSDEVEGLEKRLCEARATWDDKIGVMIYADRLRGIAKDAIALARRLSNPAPANTGNSRGTGDRRASVADPGTSTPESRREATNNRDAFANATPPPPSGSREGPEDAGLVKIGWQYRFIDKARGYRSRDWTNCAERAAENIRAHKDDPDWQVYELREVYVREALTGKEAGRG